MQLYYYSSREHQGAWELCRTVWIFISRRSNQIIGNIEKSKFENTFSGRGSRCKSIGLESGSSNFMTLFVRTLSASRFWFLFLNLVARLAGARQLGFVIVGSFFGDPGPNPIDLDSCLALQTWCPVVVKPSCPASRTIRIGDAVSGFSADSGLNPNDLDLWLSLQI